MASEPTSVLERHLEYCREIIGTNEDAIFQMEVGALRVRANKEDMTAIWVAKLKEQNDILRKNLADFEPAESDQAPEDFG
jgi:hypothetical protein